MKKVKKIIPNILVALILITGIGFLAYPTISDLLNELHSSKAIASYVERSKDMSKEEKERLLTEAKEYNQSLVHRNNRYSLSKDELSRYEQIMDVTDTGIMGYIEIPKINVYMPIYHNVDEGTLQIAVGHIPGSSVPVGGESTHSLLSGHTGLPSAKLFTNIDQLKVGDKFFIHVFDEVLAYRVDQINTVLPDEVEKLDIEEGKDYVTLITCTPYGVNSHRLLIRGERTQYNKPTKNIEEVINHTWLKFVAIIAAGVGLILIIILVYLIKRRKRRKLNEK